MSSLQVYIIMCTNQPCVMYTSCKEFVFILTIDYHLGNCIIVAVGYYSCLCQMCFSQMQSNDSVYNFPMNYFSVEVRDGVV